MVGGCRASGPREGKPPSDSGPWGWKRGGEMCTGQLDFMGLVGMRLRGDTSLMKPACP